MSVSYRKLCKDCGAPLPPSGGCTRCGAPTPALPDTEGRPELPPVRVGDLFEGKWRIETKLGAGGMGSVFQAHDLALDRKVAIKVLARELCADHQFVERFEREARLTAKLEHPNVVPVYAVGRHQGRPFMVMKKLDGDTLGYKLQVEGKLAPETVRDVFRQLCSGLAHIHAHGCVHRDIKAGNIFISPKGLATILDFGVLRDPNSHGNTQAGMMLGTPRYMSPEQAKGATDVDHRSDLYALGVLLFECLAGRPPFDAPSDLAVIHKHAQEPPPDITTLDPTLPPGLGPMLQRALAKEPADRFASAEEFSATLEAVIAAPAVGAEPLGEAPAVEPEPEPPPFPIPEAPPADPGVFDPSALPLQGPATMPLAFADPAPPPPAPAPAAEPPARAGRRWFWPTVAVIALLLAAAQLLFLRIGLGPRVDADGKEPAADTDPRTPGADPKDPRGPGRTPSPGPVRPVKTFGTLKVVSVLSDKPYAASVEVDGVERGETPLTVELATGRHVVTVSRTGFQTVRKEVVVAHRRVTEVKVDLLP